MVCSWYQPRPRPRFRLAAAIDSLRRPSEIKKKEHTSFPGNTSMYGLIMALIVILCFCCKVHNAMYQVISIMGTNI